MHEQTFPASNLVINTVRVFLTKCPLTTVRTALVRTNYKLSKAKPRIHLLFVRTKAVSNGCKRTLWKKKRVQVSDLYDKNWQVWFTTYTLPIPHWFTADILPIRPWYTTDTLPIPHRFTADILPIRPWYTTDTLPIPHRFTRDILPIRPLIHYWNTTDTSMIHSRYITDTPLIYYLYTTDTPVHYASSLDMKWNGRKLPWMWTVIGSDFKTSYILPI